MKSVKHENTLVTLDNGSCIIKFQDDTLGRITFELPPGIVEKTVSEKKIDGWLKVFAGAANDIMLKFASAFVANFYRGPKTGMAMFALMTALKTFNESQIEEVQSEKKSTH